ncbi:hypothetical protein HBI56_035860 [Parastagonospora nodorum]|nr:hypothetical protein HBH53_017190 [Parastagonospora nodorum]KAH3988268.1 hypothetical protein HBH51_000740 [Parastagonospora nodorum]KAH4056042.1 hypothetical protein HBH49_048420 [Parastagonospora nodorum]KAH4071029.1 hypothetical protein HBH50_075600 [Parastagonospora nodorum]KAH4093726.1 hypothetical protein HBH48_063850 [Parastagonospora nodorum]
MTRLYLTPIVLTRCVAYEEGDCICVAAIPHLEIFVTHARYTHTSYAVAALEPFEQENKHMQCWKWNAADRLYACRGYSRQGRCHDAKSAPSL